MQNKSVFSKALLVAAVQVACLSGSAYAQATFKISGALDLAVSHGVGDVSSRTGLDSNDYGASRLTFKGDTGGSATDLKAGYWLEAGINANNGTGQNTNTNNQPTGASGNGGLVFNRRIHASLGGEWGELRVGRDFTPQYMNIATYDPFEAGGSGISQVLSASITGPTLVRASNSISYLYGHNFNAAAIGYGPGGFKGSGLQFHAMYYMGGNPSGSATSEDGNGFGTRLTYSSGPLTVSGTISGTKYAAGDVQQNNVGASYDLGFANVMGMYEWDKKGTINATGWVAGAKIPVGNDTVRLSYGRYGTDAVGSPATKKLSFGYLHPLLKNTTLYWAIASLNNEGSATSALNGAATSSGGSSSGFDIGIFATF